jgi:hypothetical protein
MDREAILNRLRALAARTTDNGCTEAEALMAASKLASMMDRYDFDQADLATSGEPEEVVNRNHFVPRTKTLGNLKFVLKATAEFCDCRVWGSNAQVEKRGRVEVGVYFGRESDVLMAVYLTHLFETAARTGWSEYRASLGAVLDPVTGRPKANGNKMDRNSFECGMMKRLSERLREMKAARNAHVDDQTGRTGQSLVVTKNRLVEQAFQALSVKLHSRNYKTRFNVAGYDAGRSAADRVNITTGIGGSSRQSAALLT